MKFTLPGSAPKVNVTINRNYNVFTHSTFRWGLMLYQTFKVNSDVPQCSRCNVYSSLSDGSLLISPGHILTFHCYSIYTGVHNKNTGSLGN